jgi:hypothetical protein
MVPHWVYKRTIFKETERRPHIVGTDDSDVDTQALHHRLVVIHPKVIAQGRPNFLLSLDKQWGPIWGLVTEGTKHSLARG